MAYCGLIICITSSFQFKLCLIETELQWATSREVIKSYYMRLFTEIPLEWLLGTDYYVFPSHDTVILRGGITISRVVLLTDKHASRCGAYWRVSNLLTDLFSG